MNSLAWSLIILGVVLLGAGVFLLMGPTLLWLGHLPGDIRIEGERTRFYFPLATCLVLSVVLSVAMWVISKLMR